MSPALIHVFVYDGFSEQFFALPDENDRPSTDIRFGLRSALAQYLDRERLPLALDDKDFPPALACRSCPPRRAGRALVHSSARERSGLRAGWQSDHGSQAKPTRPRDLGLLQSIADRASAVIQRIQALADLERRTQQTDALTRVSQGVNITLEV